MSPYYVPSVNKQPNAWGSGGKGGEAVQHESQPPVSTRVLQFRVSALCRVINQTVRLAHSRQYYVRVSRRGRWSPGSGRLCLFAQRLLDTGALMEYMLPSRCCALISTETTRQRYPQQHLMQAVLELGGPSTCILLPAINFTPPFLFCPSNNVRERKVLFLAAPSALSDQPTSMRTLLVPCQTTGCTYPG